MGDWKRVIAAAVMAATMSIAANGSQLRMAIHSDLKTFDPAKADDDAAITVRYLTGGVLVRFDRGKQATVPELASSWKVMENGKRVRFQLRKGLTFSDGSPLTAKDVVASIEHLLAPETKSSVADGFQTAPGAIKVAAIGGDAVEVTFPAPVIGVDKLFDEVAIVPADKITGVQGAGTPTSGEYMVKDYKQGDSILLVRNPHYWRFQSGGAHGPDEIRLVVQQNRDVELSKFLNGDLHLINTVDAENYNRILSLQPKSVVDAGPSLDTDFLWFNQSPKAKIADYKRAWFTSQAFRNAISSAIDRDDLARIAFSGHAQPAVGPVSEGNAFWFNHALKPHPFNRALAMQKLRQDGFAQRNGKLVDRMGNPVAFSIITNAGNKTREKMALLIQQDLAAIGMDVKVVTLDFPSLIERMTRTLDYEACILGFTNVEVDPMAQMNVWLSSSENHQWNPSEPKPATAWEAEIDRLMREQASTNDAKTRKRAFDRVQQIVWEQEPFIYLVNKHTLSAVSPLVTGARVSKIWPQTFWNIPELQVQQK